MNFKNYIYVEFNSLSFIKKLACSVILSGQIIEGYKIFNNLTGWGNYLLLSKFLSDARLSLLTNSIIDCFKDDDIKIISDIAPDSDNFSTVWSDYAQVACSSIHYIVEAIHTGTEENIHYVPKNFIEIVDSIVQGKYYYIGISSKDLQALIYNDDLMKKEISVMNEVVERINKLSSLDYESLKNVEQGLTPFPFDKVPKE